MASNPPLPIRNNMAPAGGYQGYPVWPDSSKANFPSSHPQAVALGSMPHSRGLASTAAPAVQMGPMSHMAHSLGGAGTVMHMPTSESLEPVSGAPMSQPMSAAASKPGMDHNTVGEMTAVAMMNGMSGPGMSIAAAGHTSTAGMRMDGGMNRMDAHPGMNGMSNLMPLPFVENHITTQAVVAEQQRRIDELQKDLAAAQMEIQQLKAQALEFEREKAHKDSHGEDGKKSSSRYWTPEEHQRFLEGLAKYGQKEIKSISRHVRTRNATQVRTHAQKYYLRLQREKNKKKSDDGPTPNSSLQCDIKDSQLDDLQTPDKSEYLAEASADEKGNNTSDMQALSDLGQSGSNRKLPEVKSEEIVTQGVDVSAAQPPTPEIPVPAEGSSLKAKARPSNVAASPPLKRARSKSSDTSRDAAKGSTVDGGERRKQEGGGFNGGTSLSPGRPGLPTGLTAASVDPLSHIDSVPRVSSNISLNALTHFTDGDRVLFPTLLGGDYEERRLECIDGLSFPRTGVKRNPSILSIHGKSSGLLSESPSTDRLMFLFNDSDADKLPLALRNDSYTNIAAAAENFSFNQLPLHINELDDGEAPSRDISTGIHDEHSGTHS
mmetsp:Transcript_5038/g.15109  ORF Transcript_5038/g.15109 Transcript_5038/m.15109 type:complete len:604 (+) Transcript_5038:549-2360(+)